MDREILLVDDLEFMRLAIREILEKEGYRICGEAENGLQGYESYCRLNPDIVLLDITMPVMDGITCLKKIMSHNAEARVIMCSAMSQQEYIIRAIQYGARDFIVKPFRTERIRSAVKKVAGSL